MPLPAHCDYPGPQTLQSGATLPSGGLSGHENTSSQDGVHPPSRTYGGNIVVLPAQNPEGNRTGAVVARIETILESILDDLAKGGPSVSIPYRSRPTITRSRAENGDMPRSTSSSPLDRATHRGEVLRFPGKTRHEAKKFGRHRTCVPLSLPSPTTLIACSCGPTHPRAVPRSSGFWHHCHQEVCRSNPQSS